MKNDFGSLFRDIDKILNKGVDEVNHLRVFNAREVWGFPGKTYKVPGLIMEMFEPDPEGVRNLPDDISFQVIIHNHPVGSGKCTTPRFCFEYGFDPTVLPLKVRKNFMAINEKYFKAPKPVVVTNTDSEINFEF